MLSVVMLRVFTLSAVMQNFVMLITIMFSMVMLSVITLSVEMRNVVMMITIKFLFVILLLRVTVLSVVMLIVDIKPMMLAVNIQCHYA
jgi:hypothetical protein